MQQSQPCLKPLQQVQLRHSGNQNSLAWALNTPFWLGTAPGGRYAPPEVPEDLGAVDAGGAVVRGELDGLTSDVPRAANCDATWVL